jgi:GNAT superfamily N-acetyltransferase
VPIGPDDVGRRVVVRHALPDGRATDVLGELVAWDTSAGYARVVTKRGEVTIALGDLLLGKPIPAAPEPRRRRPGSGRAADRPSVLESPSVVELQDVMADGWQPLQRASYGGWVLRAAEGFTGRANSVLPLGDPPDPLPAAVDHAERWYAERGLPARFCLPWPLGSGPDGPGYGADAVETELVARGYVLDTPTLVMTRRTDSPDAGGRPGLEVRVSDEPDEGFLSLYRYRGEDLPPVAAQVMTSAPAQAFVSLRTDDGRTVAVGRVASSRGWSGISAVEVAPDQRRQGLAGLVMGELVRWAAERGDPWVYLQVARANHGARALYARLGFTDHSGYHYRVQPR